MNSPDSIVSATSWVRFAKNVVVLTGAGVSAESGIPTFRGSGGLWQSYRAEDLATPVAFARDPKLVWEWYDWRRQLVAKAEPNNGHRALARFERQCPGFTLITQNVDGLHRRAGSMNVLELHGSLWLLRCTRCGFEYEDQRVPLSPLPPKCPQPAPGARWPGPEGTPEVCGGLMRPGVVWFGEGLPEDVWHNAEQAVRKADVLLVAGTSAVVYPAASLAPLAKGAGARVIEINPEETPLSQVVDLSLRGLSGEILPQLLE